jgi:hypothetical protein
MPENLEPFSHVTIALGGCATCSEDPTTALRRNFFIPVSRLDREGSE